MKKIFFTYCNGGTFKLFHVIRDGGRNPNER